MASERGEFDPRPNQSTGGEPMSQSTAFSRRAFLSRAGQTTLSAGAIALLAGNQALAGKMSMGDASNDVNILNVALALEHEAIAAYQIGAESGLLQKPVLEVAVTFQGHHKSHRDALAATITKLGGASCASPRSATRPASCNWRSAWSSAR
jgi:hypothetical protein